MCVRYHHTPPGDPHTRPRAVPRSWELAAGFGDGVLGEVLAGHRATSPASVLPPYPPASSPGVRPTHPPAAR